MTTKENAREKALQEVKMYQSNGWEIAEETPEYFLLKRNTSTTGGHLLLLLFTWWSLGLCNLIYWFVGRQSKKIIK